MNFLTISYNSFAILAKSFKAIPSASPKLLNFNQDHPSKKVVFLVKTLTEVEITSLIEVLELPNFGRVTTSTI